MLSFSLSPGPLFNPHLVLGRSRTPGWWRPVRFLEAWFMSEWLEQLQWIQAGTSGGMSLLPSCSFVSVAQRLAHRPVAALTARMAVNKRLPLFGTSCIRHRDAVVSPCLLSGEFPACLMPAAKTNPSRRTVLPLELSRLLSLVL